MTTNNLGLDALTDDQIVEMARALAAEMAARNPDVVDAAKAAIAAAVARTINDQDVIWARKKWLATMVTSQFGAGWSLNVWRSTQADETRVYLDRPSQSRKSPSSKYCLYVTGGRQHPPGHLTRDDGSEKLDWQVVRLICQHAARIFPDGLRLDCDAAAHTKYSIDPMPQDVADRAEAIKSAECRAAARAAHQRAVFAAVWETMRHEHESSTSEIAAEYHASTGRDGAEVADWQVRTDWRWPDAHVQALRAARERRNEINAVFFRRRDAAVAEQMAAYDAEHGDAA